MVREIVSINVGQAGIQLGQSVWRQYCAEHEIDTSGRREEKADDVSFKCFFEETDGGIFVPRNLSVDLEPNVIDDVKNSDYGSIFNHEFLIAGKEDAANNFARGFYTVGKELLEQIVDRTRKLVDHCDNLQGFIMNHSVGGGTGSGLGALILERFTVDYRRKTKLGFEIYPSPTMSNCVVDPYNALLATSYLIDHTDVSFLLDNEAIYGLCQKNLNIRHPSYINLNRLISKVISSLTASLRFEGELNVDISDLQTNLVPFPKMHFMTTSMSPITTKLKKETFKNDVRTITDHCFNKDNFFVKLSDFDVDDDKYMAILLNYRGNVNSKETKNTVQWLKNNKKVSFVEWSPCGFRLGLNEMPLKTIEDDDIAEFDKTAVMIGNNCGIIRVFTDRINKKYDLMYSQRAFVHWYVGEGMEEGEFAEARESLAFLEKDFLEVLKEDDDDRTDDDELDASDPEF